MGALARIPLWVMLPCVAVSLGLRPLRLAAARLAADIWAPKGEEPRTVGILDL
jgi:hypothetical protein